MIHIKVLSLFDGMSCGQIALERVGIKVDTYYASEIKETAIKVTQHNYPKTVQLGGVEQLSGDELPKIDLLIGGSPCQDLSMAMRDRTGLKGEKSKLFFEYLRILEETNPRYFLLENVSKMRKEDEALMSELLGVEPIEINSSLVSAQLRKRLYWTNISNIKQPEDKGIKLNDILDSGWSERDKARCLLASDSRPLTSPVKMFHRHQKFMTLIFKSKEHYIDCKKHYGENFKGLSAKDIDNYEGDLSVYEGVRYFNQSELERLQTVPSGYTSVLNRNEAADVLGDGWTVDVIAHIFKGIK